LANALAFHNCRFRFAGSGHAKTYPILEDRRTLTRPCNHAAFCCVTLASKEPFYFCAIAEFDTMHSWLPF
jgi:hypothetical protein